MTDWQFNITAEQAGRICRTVILIHAGGRPLSWREVIAAWRDSHSFRSRCNQALADMPYRACFWETPPVQTERLDQPFEYVCVEAPSLAGVDADARAFADQFGRHCGDDGIAEFPNLGGDARLLAPCPGQPDHCYAHLLGFVRAAPAAQRDAFWRRLGEAVAQQVTSSPLWVSTSGLGVYWLHARLDSRPKYYTYAPYRDAVKGDG